MSNEEEFKRIMQADLAKWIDACCERRKIPRKAIVEHQLDRWFWFTPVETNGSGVNADIWYATPKHGVEGFPRG